MYLDNATSGAAATPSAEVMQSLSLFLLQAVANSLIVTYIMNYAFTIQCSPILRRAQYCRTRVGSSV